MTRSRVLVAAGLFAALGCGDKGKSEAPAAQAGLQTDPATDTAKPIAPPPLGLESVAAYNYAYGKGEKEWAKAEELAGKKGDKDWPGIAAACEATLLKDPGHLDAHYLLAEAMVRQGKTDPAVVEHLSKALAGDWLRWGPKLEADEDLAPLMATPGGASLKQLNATLKDAFSTTVRKGVLVVGRRASYKAPSKPGAQPMSTRAELFAFDAEAQRWVRITQTGWRLAAWTMAPSGDELAYVAFSKVNLGLTAAPAPAGGAPAPAPAAPANPPVVVEARVGVLNLLAIDQPVKEAKLKDLGGVILQYEAGDKLLATTVKLTGKWEESDAKTYVVDGQAGEAKATDPAPKEGARVYVTYDFTETERTEATGVEADWGSANDAAPTFRLTATQKTITLPRGEAASRSSFVWSPNGARVAFATWSDPCAKAAPARQSSVYVIDAATGKLKHLFKGEGRFDLKWASDDQVVYEDDKGGLRVYDAAQGRELVRHATRGGLALDGVGAISGPICKVSYKPEAAAPAEPGDEEPIGELPPEEGGE